MFFVLFKAKSKTGKIARHSVHLTGGYVPRLQALYLAQANSVKMALPHLTLAGNVNR
jgi:hypothetical protein